ncbi:hypothetical protein D9M73_238030 [compost metagenome]
MLGDQDRLKAAIAVTWQLDPHRAALGDHGLAAQAVTRIGLLGRLGLAWLIAQMQAHLGAHRPLDDGLVERQHQILNLAGRHRSFYQLVKQALRQSRQRPAGRCLRRHRTFLLHRHIHGHYLS